MSSLPTLMPTKVTAETFGGVTYHIDGELVPVLSVDVTHKPVYFEHHILLWKNTPVRITLKALRGALNSRYRAVRERAALELAGKKDAAAFDALVSMLRTEGQKQAIDALGQLGDPLYPKKANALFAEFEEIGSNRQFGYETPADLVEKYPSFFSQSVSGHIAEGVKFLSITASGRQWVANLHNHVWCAEHGRWMMGPQQ